MLGRGAALVTEAAAALLALTLTGLWSYMMARIGVYAAIRHVAARHDDGASVCLHCLRRELEKHAPQR